MEVSYAERTINDLRSLFSDEFIFEGSFVERHGANEYIASLNCEPPRDCRYVVLHEFETESSASLIYQFSKPGVNTPMAQVFSICSVST